MGASLERVLLNMGNIFIVIRYDIILYYIVLLSNLINSSKTENSFKNTN